MIRFSLLVVGLVSLAACGITAAAPAPADSGIRGRVTIGPMCPVVQEGIPCPDQPLVATIRVRRPDGKLVATARSGKEGRFRIYLAPGRYRLVPLSPAAATLPYAAPIVARVRPHAFTRVAIQYDSGIR